MRHMEMLTKNKILRISKSGETLSEERQKKYQHIDEIHKTQNFDVNREYIDHSTSGD